MTATSSRAVLWDLDGVIADTAVPHFLSWQFALQKEGFNMTRAQFDTIFGQRNDTIVRKMLGPEVSPAVIEKVSRDKEEYFRARIKNGLRPFPGVVALLKLLKKENIRSAIGSSAPLMNIQAVLGSLGLRDFFQAVVYGGEVAEGKPSPLIFQLAAYKLGVPADQCIVIEDAMAGILAARRAGMHSIAVTNTHPAACFSDADLVVDSLERVGLKELNALFERQKKLE
jgi:beta-phosphoglucomutase family hydrolase